MGAPHDRFSMLIWSGEDFSKYELCNFDLWSRLVKMGESSLFIPSEALHTSEYFSTTTLISPDTKNLLLLDNKIWTSDKNWNFGLLLWTNKKLDEYLWSISSKIDPTLFMSIEWFIDIANARNELKIALN